MKVSDIPKKRLAELNRGFSETKNLTEWLAVDQSLLLSNLAKETGRSEVKSIQKQLPKATTPKQIAWIGEQLQELDDLEFLINHSSDVVRCWACYAVAAKTESLKKSLQKMKPFAKDKHFGIREIAWMAVRNRICIDPVAAVEHLLPWAKSKDHNLRRYASEATRPRGVWAKHIIAFKKDPKPARPLLDLLFMDPERYVQDSVGNWLNDAAKDNPEWVRIVISGWQKKSDSKATAYIIKRATRSLK